MNETIHVFGHKNPDADSVISAIALAEFLTHTGKSATAFALGGVNAETKFILEKFSLPTPQILESAGDKTIALVDTTDPNQLPNDIDKADIVCVVDHHQLGGLKTNSPIDATIRPYGASATVLFELFNEKKFGASKDMLGALLCAILSDTLNLQSPTTSPADVAAVKDLSGSLKLDANSLWQELLNIKCNIDGYSDTELLHKDLKQFEFGNKKFAISQIEVASLSAIEKRLPAIKQESLNYKTDNKLFGVILIVTDLMKNGSLFISLTDDDAPIAAAFDVILQDNQAFIPGMVSRKKQVVPVMSTVTFL